MEQDKIKAVLEYLIKQWNEEQKSHSNKVKFNEEEKQDESNEESKDKIEILHFDQPGELKGRQSIILLIYI